MSKFNRPDYNYETKYNLKNSFKYRNDRDAIPPIAINADKIDADFNYIYDAVEEIWQLNVNNKYKNLPNILYEYDKNIEYINSNIKDLQLKGMMSPLGQNHIYMSKDGINITTDKIYNSQIHNLEIKAEKIANSTIPAQKLTKNFINECPELNELDNNNLLVDKIGSKNNFYKISWHNFIKNITTQIKGLVLKDKDNKLPKLDGSNLYNLKKIQFKKSDKIEKNKIYKAKNSGFLVINRLTNQEYNILTIYISSQNQNLKKSALMLARDMNLTIPIFKDSYFKILGSKSHIDEKISFIE